MNKQIMVGKMTNTANKHIKAHPGEKHNHKVSTAYLSVVSCNVSPTLIITESTRFSILSSICGIWVRSKDLS